MKALVGMYGQDWNHGILSDHASQGVKFETVDDAGNRVAHLHDGEVEPILCSELVWVWTEDGRIDGRCGLPVPAGERTCVGHKYDGPAYTERSWIDEAEAAYLERLEG